MKSTYEITKETLEAGNKGSIHNLIYYNGGEVAETILDFVKSNSNGFQADIATKGLGGISLSEKQVWCVVFEALKIKDQFTTWMSTEIASI